MNPFENATAADFDRSSARDERRTQELPFERWVDQYLEAARVGYEASEGNIDPWVILVRQEADHYARRLFTPDPDETNGDFFQRAQREARTMRATQVFVAMISRGAYGATVPSSSDATASNEFDPIFEESILWYAESPLSTRYGMIPVHLGRAGEVVENQDSAHDGASPLFADILR